MGVANAQRALNYIRTLAQFISQPEYAPVIGFFGFINEPNAGGVGKEAVGSFYLEAYRIIREVTGVGEGNGAMLGIHDGFLGVKAWYDFGAGADRFALDQHTYMVSLPAEGDDGADVRADLRKPATGFIRINHQVALPILGYFDEYYVAKLWSQCRRGMVCRVQ
jgi:hypothetical protein